MNNLARFRAGRDVVQIPEQPPSPLDFHCSSCHLNQRKPGIS